MYIHRPYLLPTNYWKITVAPEEQQEITIDDHLTRTWVEGAEDQVDHTQAVDVVAHKATHHPSPDYNTLNVESSCQELTEGYAHAPSVSLVTKWGIIQTFALKQTIQQKQEYSK